MRGKNLGDGGRGIGVRLRKKTGGRRKWDARYTKKCITKVMHCQVICCISFEWRGKLKKMQLVRVWKCRWRVKVFLANSDSQAFFRRLFLAGGIRGAVS